MSLFLFPFEGAGPCADLGQILKWRRPSWSSPGEGKRQKFVACRHDRVGGFCGKFYFSKLESRKPAPSNLLLSIFQKSAFLPNFVSKTKAPLLQACLSLSTCCHVSPRACAPPTRICELCGKKTILNRRTTFLFVCLFCFLNALFAYVLFLFASFNKYLFLVFFSFFANS